MGCVCMLVFDGGHLMYYPGNISAGSSDLVLLGMFFFSASFFVKGN